MAATASHLPVIYLAFIHLLSVASSDEHYLPATLPRLPRASDPPPTAAAAWPASSNADDAPGPASTPSSPSGITDSAVAHHDTAASARAASASDLVLPGATGTGLVTMEQQRDTTSSAAGLLRRGPVSSDRRDSAPSPSTTISVDFIEGRAVAHQDEDTTAAPPRAASPYPLGRVVPATRGATGPGPGKMSTILQLGGLPLLAVPFLPPPMAALVALSSLAAPADAWFGFGSDCPKLARPTCAVYYYNNETGDIDRRRPDPSLHGKCDHPLCHPDIYSRVALQAQQHGRGDDPLMIYCVVRDLKYPASIIPWMNIWEAYMPVGDPAAAAASGDRICYVELTHLSYREGYYIRCPNPYRDGRQSSCTLFQEEVKDEEEVIAKAVWEHRRLYYRDNVWPRYAPTEKQHDEL